jgi:hypothetical protein
VAAVGYDKRVPGERFQALFCFGVTQSWFDAERATRGQVVEAMKQAFDDLEGRFGVRVLGTFDDDEMMVGQSVSWPWTGYILAEAGDVESVIAVCDLIRETPVGTVQLWKYMRIEARIGSPLFFGTR